MTVARLRRIRVSDELTYDVVQFWCPGCDLLHQIRVSGPDPNWEWDGNLDSPTVSPSILVTMNSEPPLQCHSFLRASRWEFLMDCTHSLAGTIQPMVPLPGWLVVE